MMRSHKLPIMSGLPDKKLSMIYIFSGHSEFGKQLPLLSKLFSACPITENEALGSLKNDQLVWLTATSY